jgi:hypothetical protein
MTVQILDGNGVLQTVNTMNDFMTANPAGAQVVTASRSVSPSITIDTSKVRITSAASVNNTLVSATARVLRSLDVYNEAAYAVYIKLYDKATAPVAGTDTPFWTIPLPASSGYSKIFTWGLPVTTGLGYAITKLKADSDTTVIAANDVVGMLTYR